MDPMTAAAALQSLGNALGSLSKGNLDKRAFQLGKQDQYRRWSLEDEGRRNQFAQQQQKSPALAALLAQLAQRIGAYMPKGSLRGAQVLNPISYSGNLRPDSPDSQFARNVAQSQGGVQRQAGRPRSLAGREVFGPGGSAPSAPMPPGGGPGGGVPGGGPGGGLPPELEAALMQRFQGY